MATLKFVNEAGQEETLHVGPDRPEVLVGRNKECELRTRNNTVSRLHAKVVWRDGQYLVIDLDSANGTFYQRRRIKEAVLEDGESLFVGSLPVDFRLEPADKAPDTVAEPPPPPSEAATHTVQAADAVRPTQEYESGNLSPRDGLSTRAQGSAASMAPAPASQPIATLPADDDIVSFADERSAPAPVIRDTAAAALQGMPDRAAEAKRLLEEERVRESRDDLGAARARELEAQVAERDDRIRKLGLQVEELTRLADRLQARSSADEDAALRVTDLERVLNANEKERLVLEEQVEAERARVEEAERRTSEVQATADGLRAELESVKAGARAQSDRVATLESEIAGLQLRLEDQAATAVSGDDVARLTAERDALLEETQRWEALKRRYEADRSQAEAELEALRKQVSGLTVQVADARGASTRSESLAAELKAATDELADVKVANRSYLKKISRLLEENEALRANAGTAAPAAPAPEAAGGDAAQASLAAAREALERINEAVSRSRTGLEVIGGLLPEMLDRMPEGGGEIAEQVRSAVTDLQDAVREMKTEVLKARRA